MEFRSGFGKLNSFVLESLRGIDETIQYGQGKKRKAQISEKSIELGKVTKRPESHGSYAKSCHRPCDPLLFVWNVLFNVSFISGRKCHI
mgnify:CR=1 FL=1